MQVRLIAASVVLAALGLGVGIFAFAAGSERAQAQAIPTPAPPIPTPIQGLPDPPYIVNIDDIAFEPVVTIMRVGFDVEWRNLEGPGGPAHSTKSFEGIWDSGTLVPGETFSFHFEEVGEYWYYCEFHPDRMVGKIIALEESDIEFEPTPTPTEVLPPTDTPEPTNTATATTAPASATATAPSAATNTATTAAATATATSGAPLPPNTGSGTSSGNHAAFLWLAAALLGSSIVLGGLAVRRR